MASTEYYEAKALAHAERYGILEYRVKKNIMIYNQNYKNTEYINGKWRDTPCTYQRIVNLDTGEISTKKLQRLQKDGWHNV